MKSEEKFVITVPEKRSNFLKVHRIWGLEPEKLLMESLDVGNNVLSIFKNLNKRMYEMVQKIGKYCPKKLLSSLYM